jgi:hypothetical protein
MKKLTLSLIFLLQFGLPAFADVFDDKLWLLCSAITPTFDEQKIYALLKDPYLILNRQFPGNAVNCANRSPLYMFLAGNPRVLQALLSSGATLVITDDTAKAEGAPLTWAQTLLFPMLMVGSATTSADESFRVLWKYAKINWGELFIQSGFAAPNGTGKNVVQWICTQQPNPHFGHTFWQLLQINGGENALFGRNLVTYAAKLVGLSGTDTAKLCPGWQPPSAGSLPWPY